MEQRQAGSKRITGDELRDATFPQALRGYDREAVHALLDRVADWVESRAPSAAGAAGGIQGELARVGERTAAILTAAEETASKLSADAKAYADGIRASAEGEARKARLSANQKAEELIAEAEAKAEKIIDDAIARRRGLNQAITSLLERRDEIVGEAARLADELLEAVDAVRGSEPIPGEERAAAEREPEAEAEPEDEEEDEEEARAADDVEADEAPRWERRGPRPPEAVPPSVEPRRFQPAPAPKPTELDPPNRRQTSINPTSRPR